MVPPLSKWRGRPETAEQHDARVQAQDVVAIRSMTKIKKNRQDDCRNIAIASFVAARKPRKKDPEQLAKIERHLCVFP
jgi:hypothetical protein